MCSCCVAFSSTFDKSWILGVEILKVFIARRDKLEVTFYGMEEDALIAIF